MQKSCLWLDSCLLLFLIFFFLQVSLKAQSSQNQPPLPCDFYGGEETPGSLTPGKIIIARDSDGVIIGQTNVTQSGRYGFLTCLGDISNTSEDEGAVSGDIITFYLDGTKQRQQAVWKSGEAIKVDLGIPAEGGAFNLHILATPGYSNYNNDPRYSGAAVSDMILDYLDETNSDTQVDLMSYADTNRNLENEISELERLLNVKAPSMYNFGSTTTLQIYSDRNYINQFDSTSQSDCLKQICHWVAYQVPHASSDKQYVPVVIATSANPAQNSDSDWRHWMCLVGVRTNQDPFPSLSDYASFREEYDVPASIQLYGVYLNDPAQNGLGFHTYMAANVFTQSYLRPIAAGLPGAGAYAAILEPPPPEANSITIQPAKNNSDFEIILKTPQTAASFFVPGWISPAVKEYLSRVFQQLKSSADFSGLIEDSYFGQALKETTVSRIFKVEAEDNGYTVVPFEKEINGQLATTAAVIVNNQTGQFEIAFGNPTASTVFNPPSWPESYQALRKEIGWNSQLLNRWLSYTEGNILYPGWKAVTLSYHRNKGVLLVNSFLYSINPEKVVSRIDASPQVEILQNRSLQRQGSLNKTVIFNVNHPQSYTVSIDQKGEDTKVYLYSSHNRWLVVLSGPENSSARIRVSNSSLDGEISQAGATYLYITNG